MRWTHLEKEVEKLIGQSTTHTPDLVIFQGQVTQLSQTSQNNRRGLILD